MFLMRSAEIDLLDARCKQEFYCHQKRTFYRSASREVIPEQIEELHNKHLKLLKTFQLHSLPKELMGQVTRTHLQLHSLTQELMGQVTRTHLQLHSLTKELMGQVTRTHLQLHSLTKELMDQVTRTHLKLHSLTKELMD
nr:hypothetical protein BgiMline_026468 [Biomphalaria glabrata]